MLLFQPGKVLNFVAQLVPILVDFRELILQSSNVLRMIVARVLQFLFEFLNFARLLLNLVFSLLSFWIFILQVANLILELFATLLQTPLLSFKALDWVLLVLIFRLKAVILKAKVIDLSYAILHLFIVYFHLVLEFLLHQFHVLLDPLLLRSLVGDFIEQLSGFLSQICNIISKHGHLRQSVFALLCCQLFLLAHLVISLFVFFNFSAQRFFDSLLLLQTIFKLENWSFESF